MLRSTAAVGRATLCGAAATGAHSTHGHAESRVGRARDDGRRCRDIRRLTTDDELAPWRMSLGLRGVVVELESCSSCPADRAS